MNILRNWILDLVPCQRAVKRVGEEGTAISWGLLVSFLAGTQGMMVFSLIYSEAESHARDPLPPATRDLSGKAQT